MSAQRGASMYSRPSLMSQMLLIRPRNREELAAVEAWLNPRTGERVPPSDSTFWRVECAGSPTFRTFVRQEALSRRIACCAGVRIPSERCGLRLLQ